MIENEQLRKELERDSQVFDKADLNELNVNLSEKPILLESESDASKSANNCNNCENDQSNLTFVEQDESIDCGTLLSDINSEPDVNVMDEDDSTSCKTLSNINIANNNEVIVPNFNSKPELSAEEVTEQHLRHLEECTSKIKNLEETCNRLSQTCKELESKVEVVS